MTPQAQHHWKSALLAAAVTMALLAAGQQIGTDTPEAHPPLTTYRCTKSGGCVAQATSLVLDWHYRRVHTAAGASCLTSDGRLNASLCGSSDACYANCFVEGIPSYAAAGVTTNGDALTLRQYMPAANGSVSKAAPRVYLLDAAGRDYADLRLLGQEISFDFDASALPCGENGALYLSAMSATGGRSATNPGGAAYGAAYCDAQCPVIPWFNGSVNTAGAGFCCDEMDLMEGNGVAQAFTPHPCVAPGAGTDGCDKAGCGFNPYGQGAPGFYGPGKTLDSMRPFTVTTRFLPGADGALATIERVYTQDGRTLASARSGQDAITTTWCAAQDGAAAANGGLPVMGEALARGMVLIFSIWNDPGQDMNWLDSGDAGPCNASDGDPATIEQQTPGTHVVFSNIRWGDIGSTTGNRTSRA
ncbi:hypothetical protein P8C59_002782 [Phyllachora maydis]|uniref:Glucanase n=1 Tax=Phyllachora maydis TaxID=1825666 RepID=A0AAD9HYW4_9PEZI|nr:hypothetical protein P8C59_002782 [Phyllachora maydis]